MTGRAFLLTLASGLLLAGCAAKQGGPIDFANACKIENDGKYVELTGYLQDRGSVFCSNIGSSTVNCGMTITATADGKDGYLADIEQGSGSNQIEKFEGSYKKENLKIRDNTGGFVKIGDKVKLTGKFSVPPDAKGCFMHADKIERQ